MNQFYDIERSFSPQTKEEAHKMIQNQVRAFLQLAKKERAILQVVQEAIDYQKKYVKMGRDTGTLYKQYYAGYYILSRKWISTA